MDIDTIYITIMHCVKPLGIWKGQYNRTEGDDKLSVAVGGGSQISVQISEGIHNFQDGAARKENPRRQHTGRYHA